MEKPEYQDKIPITPAIKSLILELCESSKQVSSDQRYRKIIDQIKTDVETFENKPIHEIKTLL